MSAFPTTPSGPSRLRGNSQSVPIMGPPQFSNSLPPPINNTYHPHAILPEAPYSAPVESDRVRPTGIILPHPPEYQDHSDYSPWTYIQSTGGPHSTESYHYSHDPRHVHSHSHGDEHEYGHGYGHQQRDSGHYNQTFSSPYEYPSNAYNNQPLNSSDSTDSRVQQMSDYFPPYPSNQNYNNYSTAQSTPLQSNSNLFSTQSESYAPGPSSSSSVQPSPFVTSVPLMPTHHHHLDKPTMTRGGGKIGPIRSQSGNNNNNNTKTGRQQFSACGACRHRRVKCDLKEKQEQMERETTEEEERGYSQSKGNGKGRKKAICSNCEERGVACIDEYAPLKAAKQLRRGKRISEIEILYGRQAANAALANTEEGILDPFDSSEKGGGGGGRGRTILPELTKEFFESAFFRRFQVQRPVLDPQDFINRYLSNPQPCAAALGPEGAILCHVLYAWALSYGVDENGQLDVPEGGGELLGPLPLGNPSDNELRRESDRIRRFEKMGIALEVILREIDECGVLRKPSWDGVRALLLVLPLTEGISSNVERLAMYEAALGQVFTLCSFDGVGYDGNPSGSSGVNGGTDLNGESNIMLIRVRIYWYAFVHEGITSGLKGGRLMLDDEDLETMQDSIHNRSIVISSSSFKTTVKFATAPINLALACRLINRALSGPRARRSKTVNPDWVKDAWEALEKSWEEFESLKYAPDTVSFYNSPDDIIRFADGWKIFLFEAQNIIRKILEERLSRLQSQHNDATVSDFNRDPMARSIQSEKQLETINISRLLEISQSKCEVKCRQILDMIKRHVGTRFFEWDASLVRDGTFYAAKLLPRLGGTEEDVAVCLQALNELRWAHAKALDRSGELRREWAEVQYNSSFHRSSISLPTLPSSQSWNNLNQNQNQNPNPTLMTNPSYLAAHTTPQTSIRPDPLSSSSYNSSSIESKNQSTSSSTNSPFHSPNLISGGFYPSRDQLNAFGGIDQQSQDAFQEMDIKPHILIRNDSFDQNNHNLINASGVGGEYDPYGRMLGPPPLNAAASGLSQDLGNVTQHQGYQGY